MANMSNTHVPVFNSKWSDRLTVAVNCFTQDWRGENNWVCPGFHLVEAVLEHLRECKATATVVVPVWRTKPWYCEPGGGVDLSRTGMADASPAPIGVRARTRGCRPRCFTTRLRCGGPTSVVCCSMLAALGWSCGWGEQPPPAGPTHTQMSIVWVAWGGLAYHFSFVGV